MATEKIWDKVRSAKLQAVLAHMALEESNTTGVA